MRNMHFGSRPVWRYAMAALLVGAAFALRQLLSGYFHDRAAFITFYPAVMLIGLLAGLGPGLLATGLATFLAAGWVLPPPGSPAFQLNVADIIGLTVFFLMGSFIVFMIELYHRAQRRASELEKLALRESEDRFRALFDVAVHGVCLSREGRILEVNEELARMLGYQRREMAGMYATDFVAPENAAAVMQLITGDQETMVEYPVRRKDGSYIDVEIHGRIFEMGGQKVRITSLRDITQRKRAEEEMRQSEARLALALEAAELGYWEVNLETEELVVSPRFHEICGVDANHGIKTRKEWRTYVVDEDVSSLQKAAEDAATSGKRYQLELRIRRRSDGAVRWVFVEGRRESCSRGQPKRLVGVIGDITERKQAEQSLRSSEAHFRALFEHSMDAIFLIIPYQRITAVNPAACAMFGKTEEELIRGGREAIINPDDPRHLVMVEERRRTGRVHIEASYIRKNGERFEGEVTSVIVPGEPSRAFVTIRDISQRKRAERLLKSQAEHLETLVQERTAKLESAIQELEHFSYCITHDMRAPLRAMRSYGELLVTQACPACNSQIAKKYLERIMSAAERMDGLIVDALDYSKVARGEVNLEPMDVRALLTGVLDSYPNLHSDNAEIRLEGEFPRVLGYGAGLTQCFSNLLGNAVKFVAPGVSPKVRVWAELVKSKDSAQGSEIQEATQWVRIWFEDNGIGIPKGCEKRIFEMFQRLGISNEGTGIGLAIVEKSVERMGGRVGVESEAGKGSRFWVELKQA